MYRHEKKGIDLGAGFLRSLRSSALRASSLIESCTYVLMITVRRRVIKTARAPVVGQFGPWSVTVLYGLFQELLDLFPAQPCLTKNHSDVGLWVGLSLGYGQPLG